MVPHSDTLEMMATAAILAAEPTKVVKARNTTPNIYQDQHQPHQGVHSLTTQM